MAISLDQINQEADKKFGPFVVTGVPGGDVTLRNAVRLAKSERDKVRQMQGKIKTLRESQDETGTLKLLADFFDILSVGDGGKRLVKEIGDDPAKLMVLMEMYAEDTQLGEALRSAS